MNVGVTSGGDLFGGTQITFTDVLGDKQFNMFAASVSQYRTMSFSYINLSRRLQYALQAYSQTQFYYGYQPGLLYDYDYAYLDRDDALATQTARGATAFGIYPLNRYARLQLSAGLLQFKQAYQQQELQDLADQFQEETYGRTLFNSGQFMPLGVEYIQETTVFREYGPLAGNTVRLGYEYAPSMGDFMSRQTAELDARCPLADAGDVERRGGLLRPAVVPRHRDRPARRRRLLVVREPATADDAAQPGQILVSRDTYRLTQEAFTFVPLDPILVKGKRDPLVIYELTRRPMLELARGPGPAAVSAQAALALTVQVVRAGGDVPVAGARVIAFTDFEERAGAEAVSDATGMVRLDDTNVVEKGRVSDKVVYLTADQEEGKTIAQANAEVDEKGNFIGKVTARNSGNFLEVAADEVDRDALDATGLEPFLLAPAGRGPVDGLETPAELAPLVLRVPLALLSGLAHRVGPGAGDDADAVAALSGFQRFPAWMWRNTEVRDFVEWLREYNIGRTPRTKVLLFCSPSNPTGAVYPAEQVEEIVRLARQRGG